MMKKQILIISVLILTVSLHAQYVSDVSKRGTTAAPFLNISQGARASGMGSAFVGIADDPTAIYWNVAGIARLGHNAVVFDHTNWFADLKYNFLAATVDVGSFGTIGASLIMSDYGEMDVTTVERPEGTGETFKVTDIAFSIAWAYNLTEDFSIGFNPKIIYQGIWNMNAYSYAVDMGVLYSTPFKGITVGMSITNFGAKMKMSGNNAVVLHDPDESTTGNNGRIPSELLANTWSLPLGFKLGVSYQTRFDNLHGLILGFDAAHPNDNYEYVNLGAEYSFKNMLFLRGGYKSLFQVDSEESFTLGVGFLYQVVNGIGIRFDYSYADFGRLNNTQKFSVGVNF
jgi:hypothetical protein